jgi:hypothetical protein
MQYVIILKKAAEKRTQAFENMQSATDCNGWRTKLATLRYLTTVSLFAARVSPV